MRNDDCQELRGALELGVDNNYAAMPLNVKSLSKSLFAYITVFVAGMALMRVFYGIGPEQDEMWAHKRAWGESMATVDALAEAVVAWSQEEGRDRLPEDLSVLKSKLSPKAKGAMYFLIGDAENQRAYAALPLLASPTKAAVPGYTFIEIRHPIATSLPPGFMTHGMRSASWQGFHEMLAGQKWTVQVVP